MSAMASQITGANDCLPSRLFRRRSKETSKLRVAGLCVGNSPVIGEFPAQRSSNVEKVSIWWRHQCTPGRPIQMAWRYYNLLRHIDICLLISRYYNISYHAVSNHCNEVVNYTVMSTSPLWQRLNYMVRHWSYKRRHESSFGGRLAGVFNTNVTLLYAQHFTAYTIFLYIDLFSIFDTPTFVI